MKDGSNCMSEMRKHEHRHPGNAGRSREHYPDKNYVEIQRKTPGTFLVALYRMVVVDDRAVPVDRRVYPYGASSYREKEKI